MVKFVDIDFGTDEIQLVVLGGNAVKIKFQYDLKSYIQLFEDDRELTSGGNNIRQVLTREIYNCLCALFYKIIKKRQLKSVYTRHLAIKVTLNSWPLSNKLLFKYNSRQLKAFPYVVVLSIFSRARVGAVHIISTSIDKEDIYCKNIIRSEKSDEYNELDVSAGELNNQSINNVNNFFDENGSDDSINTIALSYNDLALRPDTPAGCSHSESYRFSKATETDRPLNIDSQIGCINNKALISVHFDKCSWFSDKSDINHDILDDIDQNCNMAGYSEVVATTVHAVSEENTERPIFNVALSQDFATDSNCSCFNKIYHSPAENAGDPYRAIQHSGSLRADCVHITSVSRPADISSVTSSIDIFKCKQTDCLISHGVAITNVIVTEPNEGVKQCIENRTGRGGRSGCKTYDAEPITTCFSITLPVVTSRIISPIVSSNIKVIEKKGAQHSLEDSKVCHSVNTTIAECNGSFDNSNLRQLDGTRSVKQPFITDHFRLSLGTNSVNISTNNINSVQNANRLVGVSDSVPETSSHNLRQIQNLETNNRVNSANEILFTSVGNVDTENGADYGECIVKRNIERKLFLHKLNCEKCLSLHDEQDNVGDNKASERPGVVEPRRSPVNAPSYFNHTSNGVRTDNSAMASHRDTAIQSGINCESAHLNQTKVTYEHNPHKHSNILKILKELNYENHPLKLPKDRSPNINFNCNSNYFSRSQVLTRNSTRRDVALMEEEKERKKLSNLCKTVMSHSGQNGSSSSRERVTYSGQVSRDVGQGTVMEHQSSDLSLPPRYMLRKRRYLNTLDRHVIEEEERSEHFKLQNLASLC